MKWFLKEVVDLKRSENKLVNVKIPKPPSWIVTRMTILPKKVKVVSVSKTARPVTVAALVAVNSASIAEIPLTVDDGSDKKYAEIRIKTTKDITNNTAGWILEDPRLLILWEKLMKAVTREKISMKYFSSMPIKFREKFHCIAITK